MRNFIIFTSVIVILALAFYIYVRITTKPVIYSSLSIRAKEYLKMKKDSDDKDWKNTNVDSVTGSVEVQATKKVTDLKCFSLTVPFPASEVRKEADCQYRVFITSPAGYVTAYMRAMDVNLLDEEADISMRRVYKDKYLEKKVVINGRTYLTFKGKGDDYEASAFYLKNKKLYVFNLLVPTNENLDKKFDEMLQSIKIYNE